MATSKAKNRLENKNMIPVLEPDISDQELALVADAVKSGWVSSSGEYIRKFEEGFAAYCGRKFGVSTSNGTHALHLALTALGIGPGDEVIVPNLTFIASANAVSYTGAKPVLVDIEKDTWNLDPAKIEEKINNRTKAIMVVHLYGNPCEMEKIMAIAAKHNLYLVEDAAEAHGSIYQNKKCGSFGDISCFSFYGNKMITTGEGGMCLTDNPELITKMNLYKHHGMTPYKEYNKKYWHEVIGFNYRMTNLQAALGCAQLNRIDSFIAAKRANDKLYRELLAGVTEITFQKIQAESVSNCWLTSILINSQKTNSDQVAEKLKSEGIDTRNIFFAISTMNPYHQDSGYRVSTEIAAKGLSLPSASKLTEENVQKICLAIKNALV